MPKDPRGHVRLLDERDQARTAAATRARQHVEPERPGHEGCPRLATGVASRGRRGFRLTRLRGGRVLRHGIAALPGRLAPHHLSPPGGPGPQHAVVQDQVDPRSWHEHGQSRQKLSSVEHDVRRPSRHGCRSGNRTCPSEVRWIRPCATGGGAHSDTAAQADPGVPPAPPPPRADQSRSSAPDSGPLGSPT